MWSSPTQQKRLIGQVPAAPSTHRPTWGLTAMSNDNPNICPNRHFSNATVFDAAAYLLPVVASTRKEERMDDKMDQDGRVWKEGKEMEGGVPERTGKRRHT